MVRPPRMRALIGAFAALLAGPARAQAPDPLPRQLADLHALVLDPSRTFSIRRARSASPARSPSWTRLSRRLRPTARSAARSSSSAA